MAGMTLAADEVVLSELIDAQDASKFTTKFCNVILTNKRIVVNKVGAFGKAKFDFEKPLSAVKTYNGAAQVKVSTVNGLMTKIDIYLSSEQLSYEVSGAGNTDVIRFANELNRVVTGSNVDIYSLSGNDTGASAFKKAFWGINSVEAKKNVNQKVAIRCTGCGGSFEGIKGSTAKCPYCGTFYNT